MRNNILGEIEALKDLTHAIILTHDVDLLFLQGLVLRALKRAGDPSLTVFADAGRAASSFAAQADLSVGLGQRYRLVPVSLKSRGRFHPKAVLLAGPTGATLYVGSGNLTFGGWCHNGEVWTRFRTEDGEGDAVSAFKVFLDELVELLPLSEPLRAELTAMFDPTSRPWANPLPPPAHLIGRLGQGPSLLDRLRERLTGSSLSVCSPFFDPDGEALRRLIEASGASEVEVLTQESSTNLRPQALASWPSFVRAVPVDFEHLTHKGDPRHARVHAKWILAAQGARATAVVGSANCSRAALTSSAGNAELVAVIEGARDDLASALRSELKMHGRPLQLPAEPAEGEEDDAELVAEPAVLAARFDHGTLHVAVAERGGFVARQIEVDDALVPTEVRPQGHLVASVERSPRLVRVHGVCDGEPKVTSAMWVDIEHQLRGSAGRRRLVDLVRQYEQGGVLDVDVWADLVEATFEEISSPSVTVQGGGARAASAAHDARPWRVEDVFHESFGLSRSHDAREGADGDSDTVSETLSLLSAWCRGEEGVDRLDAPESDEETDADSVEPEPDDEEEAETPSKRPKPRRAQAHAKRTRRQERALATLRQMISALASLKFIRERSPADLRRAFLMIALLLLVGRREGWVSGREFFACTQLAWHALFFYGSEDSNRGELAARLDAEQDVQAFQDALATPRLGAALAAWGIAAHREVDGPELARFDLVCALSAAHHPWMWRGAPLDQIAVELRRLQRHTFREDDRETFASWWLTVQRRGAALAALEEVLRGEEMASLRSRLRPWQIDAGALLWQGRRGWCVSEERASTEHLESTVPIRRLQGDGASIHMVVGYMVPVVPLIRALSSVLSASVRAELESLSREIASSYRNVTPPRLSEA